MTKNEILKKINEIFIEVMELDDNFKLSENMTAEDIEEWDSLTHIQLIKALEKSFGIKFTAKEVMEWEDVQDCIDSIESKINKVSFNVMLRM